MRGENKNVVERLQMKYICRMINDGWERGLFEQAKLAQVDSLLLNL
jgi:hypothetical protein